MQMHIFSYYLTNTYSHPQNVGFMRQMNQLTGANREKKGTKTKHVMNVNAMNASISVQTLFSIPIANILLPLVPLLLLLLLVLLLIFVFIFLALLLNFVCSFLQKTSFFLLKKKRNRTKQNKTGR